MSDKPSKGFSADEKAAMKERAKELKAVTDRESGERDLLAKIAEMPDSDRDDGRADPCDRHDDRA